MRVAALDAGGRVIARGVERQTYAIGTLRRPGRR
jgi:hypothetical protein